MSALAESRRGYDGRLIQVDEPPIIDRREP